LEGRKKRALALNPLNRKEGARRYRKNIPGTRLLFVLAFKKKKTWRGWRGRTQKQKKKFIRKDGTYFVRWLI